MAIRYTPDYNQQIRRIVYSYNRKLARIKPRLQQQGVGLLDQLQPVTTAELKSEYSTRYYLNRRLKEMQRFIERGSERVVSRPTKVKLTQYQYESIKRQQRASKAAYTVKIKNYQVKSAIDKNFGKESDPGYQRLVARREALNRNIEFLTEKELASLNSTAAAIYNRGIKRQQFYSQYLQTIYDMADKVGFDKRHIDAIMNHLTNMSALEFERSYQDFSGLEIIMDNYHGLTDTSADGPEMDPAQVTTALKSIYREYVDPTAYPELSEDDFDVA